MQGSCWIGLQGQNGEQIGAPRVCWCGSECVHLVSWTVNFPRHRSKRVVKSVRAVVRHLLNGSLSCNRNSPCSTDSTDILSPMTSPRCSDCMHECTLHVPVQGLWMGGFSWCDDDTGMIEALRVLAVLGTVFYCGVLTAAPHSFEGGHWRRPLQLATGCRTWILQLPKHAFLVFSACCGVISVHAVALLVQYAPMLPCHCQTSEYCYCLYHGWGVLAGLCLRSCTYVHAS